MLVPILEMSNTSRTKQTAFMIMCTAVAFSLWIYYRYEMIACKLSGIHGRQADIPSDTGPKTALPFSHNTKVDGVESNAAQPFQVRFNTSDYHSELQPLQDFRKYPCVKGLPVFPEEKWDTEGTCVRTFYDTGNKNVNISRCVTLKTLRGETPTCTYSADSDIYISASLQKASQWEAGLVNSFGNFLKTRPNTEFLDLGCNIGVYTLSFAHLGIKVTAIDPLIENLELLSYSLHLGKLSNNVTLIWNAVSNEHKLVKFAYGERNVGGTHIIDYNLTSVKNTRTYVASTVTLDDLLPIFIGKHVAIKMDIEGGEYNALLGANKFFEKVHIDVIQMEVLITQTLPDGAKIVNFLASRGFYPYRDINKLNSLKNLTLPKWPSDVYFMKP